MPFKFGESPIATDHLASIWIRSDSGRRLAITAASDHIERILTHSADSVGVSHPFGNLPTAQSTWTFHPLLPFLSLWSRLGRFSFSITSIPATDP